MILRAKGDAHWTRRHPEYRHPWAKLPPDQIATILARIQAGETQSSLAREFGIGRTTVWRYRKCFKYYVT